MHVHRLGLTQFMLHDKTEIVLPEKGVMLITGENGSGKSSMPEAVATCGWGKSLRKSTGWRNEGLSRVDMAVGALGVALLRNGGAPILSFTAEGEEIPDYPTTTKAQAALEERIGDYDTWRRCSVFTTSDASTFTKATDGDRKRLIEGLLEGFDRFDPAVKACRADLRKVTKELDGCGNERRVLDERLTNHSNRLIELEADLESVKDSEDAEVIDVEKLESQLAKIKKMVWATNSDMNQLDRKIRVLQ